MIKAVIFDLDGTLTYTLDSIAISGNLALEAIGMQPYDTERYKYFCGDGVDELVKRILYNNGDTEYAKFDIAKEKYSEFFAKYANYKVDAYEGMPEVLRELKAKGLKLAVFSNKPHKQAVEVVNRIFGENTFDHIQGKMEEVKRKPDPEGAFMIIRKLQVVSDEVLYVGDTSTDMQTGHNAGFHTLGALWGYRDLQELKENKAENIAVNPQDILKYV